MLKPRKNKAFKYTPRFSKDIEVHAEKRENSKFIDFRTKWRNNLGTGNRKRKRWLSLPLLLLLLVIIVLCMYIIDIKFN